jgi:hypothetical protein
MIRVIKYFFYKIYSFSLSNGETDSSWAMVGVSMFTLANVYSFFDIILILTHSKLPQLGKPAIIVFCCMLLYFNYSLLVKNGKSKEIVKEFKEMEGSKAMLNLFLFLYITVSIVLFIYTGNVVRNMNH